MASDIGEANLPFGLGKLDFLDSPAGAVMGVVALILGFVVFHMADSIGAQLSNRVNSILSSVTGVNVDGGSSGPGVV